MKKVKFGILGCAHVHTKTYIDCFLKNGTAGIIGFYDDDPERSADIKDIYGLPFFDSPGDLLRQKPDFVLVCSENVNHCGLVSAAAEYGIDVICEKPLGITKEQLDQMLGVCGKHGVRLMTTFPNRYIHSFLDAKEAIASGRIGDLLAVKATNKGTMPGGWFIEPELSGGGCVIDHTVHVADLLNWMFGEIPASVYAVAEKKLFPENNCEDVAFVHFTYPSGVMVSLDSSWSRTGAFPYGRDLTMTFIGTGGTIFIDYFAENNQVYSCGAKKAEWSYYGEDKDQLMVNDIVDAYRTGREFPITGQDGYNSSIVAVAAYKSIEQKREVLISEL